MIKMVSISKLFEVLATSLRSSNVDIARIKLTVFYEIVIFLILTLFSFGIYGLLDKPLGKALGYNQVGITFELTDNKKEDLTKQVILQEKERIREIIFIVDSIILVVSSGLSYFLAGYTLKPIKENYEKQKKFLADAAHELRTPLAVMKTGMQVTLKETPNIDEYKKVLEESVEEINFLNSIVEDMLFLAKSNQLKQLVFERVDFGKLAAKQVALMQPYAHLKGVSLECTVSEGCMISGYESYLKRLIANVIKNAIDYNVTHGTVNVSCMKRSNEVVLVVTDTGIGIPQASLKKIFDRFYKADVSREKQSSGAGLGLSIVHEIVKSHQGHIVVESVLHKGTTLSVSFPSFS